MTDDFGWWVALLVLLGSSYEFVALNSRLPTISRIVQGWRDRGKRWQVLGLTLLCISALGTFASWLYHHFLYDKRSDL